MKQYKEFCFLERMLVLIDKVAHFGLTQGGYFTGWVNYIVLWNQEHFLVPSPIPPVDSET